MKEAFNYMFKDNMFAKKALTYVGFAFIANLVSNIANTLAPQQNTLPSLQYILLFILGAILMLIPSGYGISCIKAFIEQRENFVIPFLNVKNNFILGFKLGVAILIMSLVFGLGITLISIVLAIIFSIVNAVKAGLILLGVFTTIIVAVIAYYSLAFSYIFATTEKFTSFLQFRTATGLMKADLKHYTISALIFIAFSIAIGIISALLFILSSIFGILGLIVAVLATSLIGGYTVYVYSYLTAKSIKN